tara:strand:+ start:322 stop:513 length:192 start_codon:yes stop_codon:yes gene_type:complete
MTFAEEIEEEFEPFTLSYTWHKRIGDERYEYPVVVYCSHEEIADLQMRLMFEREGRSVIYSID